jgi:hypothetical protein
MNGYNVISMLKFQGSRQSRDKYDVAIFLYSTPFLNLARDVVC